MGIQIQLNRDEIKKMAKEPNLTWRENALVNYILRMFVANGKLTEDKEHYENALVSFYNSIQKNFPFVAEKVKRMNEGDANALVEKAKAMFPPTSAPMMNPPFDAKERSALG